MTHLQVQPRQYVAKEIEQKSRTRYRKAQVAHVTVNEIILVTGEHYDLDGFPLARNGQRKQITSETDILVPLTSFIEQRIERQELVDEIANIAWMMWMQIPTPVLQQIRGLLHAAWPQDDSFL